MPPKAATKPRAAAATKPDAKPEPAAAAGCGEAIMAGGGRRGGRGGRRRAGGSDRGSGYGGYGGYGSDRGWSGRRGRGGRGRGGPGRGGRDGGPLQRGLLEGVVCPRGRGGRDGDWEDDGGGGAVGRLSDPQERLAIVDEVAAWLERFTRRAVRVDELRRLVASRPSGLSDAVLGAAMDVERIYVYLERSLDEAQKLRQTAHDGAIAASLGGRFSDTKRPGTPVEDEAALQALLVARALDYGGVPLAQFLARHNGVMRRRVAEAAAPTPAAAKDVPVTVAMQQLQYDRASGTFYAMYETPGGAAWIVAFRIARSNLQPTDFAVFAVGDDKQRVPDGALTLLPYMDEKDVAAAVLDDAATTAAAPSKRRAPAATRGAARTRGEVL